MYCPRILSLIMDRLFGEERTIVCTLRVSLVDASLAAREESALV